MIKVKFFVGDDTDLDGFQTSVEDWLSGVTPTNVSSSVHYDNGWHIIVIVYYQDTSNIVIPTMKFQRID